MLLPRHTRPGLSLLEVILALAIFLTSITGLVFLMGVATDAALETQMRSQAISICQSRLAEVSAGAIPLQGSPKTACDDDSDYQWSMDVESGSYDGLSKVTVHVSRKRANGKLFECSLSQMVFDPARVGTVFDAAKDSSSSSSDGSSGTGSSGAAASAAAPAAAGAAGAAAPKPAASGTGTPATSPKTTPAPTTPSSKGGASKGGG